MCQYSILCHTVSNRMTDYFVLIEHTL
uniref:Uncharacterized protein n=1 Tax=Anguilla anguilla TaxID=7936 RepID=A0A0E9RFJ4_ANGAN